jgi:hypothetical protein
MTASTAFAVVVAIASLFALAGGVGVALRDRWTRRTVAQRAQSLSSQLAACSRTIDEDANRLAKSSDELNRLVGKVQSALADHGDHRRIEWSSESLQSATATSAMLTGARTAVRDSADSLNKVAGLAKELPIEVVLYAPNTADALVALVAATDDLTKAATELDQTEREFAPVIVDSFPEVAAVERIRDRLITAASAVERAYVSINALRESINALREALPSEHAPAPVAQPPAQAPVEQHSEADHVQA